MYMLSFLLSLIVVLCHSKTLADIRYCQIGLGHSGQRALKRALQKGVTLVAAFTRTSFIGTDVGEILGLPDKLGIVVSSSKDLNQILQDTKPDICHDATKDDLELVYEHFKIVLSNGVNLITLASHLIFPYKPNDIKMAMDLDKIAKENGVTLCVTGIQDTYYQTIVLSMISTMNYMNTLDVAWIPKSDEVKYWSDKGSQETKDILQPFTIQMIKWYAFQLQWNESSLNCLYDDKSIMNVWNLTCIFDGYSDGNKDEKLYIIWRNEFFHDIGNDEISSGMVVRLIGEPDQELKLKELPLGVSCNIAINRIPQVLAARPGFYSIHKLGIGEMLSDARAKMQIIDIIDKSDL